MLIYNCSIIINTSIQPFKKNHKNMVQFIHVAVYEALGRITQH